jgi:peptide chain release factor subunit 1
VTPLTADTVRSLTGFKGASGPVVSLYLNVDGQQYIRPRDYETQLEHLLREAREAAAAPANGSSSSSNPSANHGSAVEGDLRRLEAYVKGGLDRSQTRGLALFSCAADGFFEAIHLGVPVRNQLVVNLTPHVLQLEATLERYQRFGVLLLDRQRARMLVFELGQLHDRSELFDELPRHDDDRGDWDRDHLRDHTAAIAQQHVKRAADVALHIHQHRPLDHLILAGPDTAVHEVERELHSYLRDRVAARLRLPTTATDDEIRHATMEIEAQVDRLRTDALVQRLRDALGASGSGLLGLARPNAPAAPVGAGVGSGVAGLDAVLHALVEHRVDTLLVSDGYEAPGWRCPNCDNLAMVGRTCPVCATDMDRVTDIVEEAVEAALAQSGRVVVCSGCADLDCLGRIGALLRF